MMKEVGPTMIIENHVDLKCSAMILVAATLLPLLGCGGSSDVGRVKGIVTLDGQAVADATVEFSPEGEGRPSTGMTDTDGHYDLAYTATETGAKIGKHTVTITTGGMKSDSNGNLTKVPETIPEKYNVKTELIVEVTSGKNTHDFYLKSQ